MRNGKFYRISTGKSLHFCETSDKLVPEVKVMEHKYAVGNYICQLRTGKGYTQKELGALLGVTDKAVSEWENGAALPRRELLRRLAAVLGCSQEELHRGGRIGEPAAKSDICTVTRDTETGAYTGQSAEGTAETKKIRGILWKAGLCLLAILALLFGVFGFQKGIWNGTSFYRVSAEGDQRVYSGRSDFSVLINSEKEQNTLVIRSKAGKSAQLCFRTTQSSAAQSVTILTAEAAPVLSRTYLNQTDNRSAWQNDRRIAEQIWKTAGWYPTLSDQAICGMALRLEQTRIRGRAGDVSMAVVFVALGFLICFFMDFLIKLDIRLLGLIYKHADHLCASRWMRVCIGASGSMIVVCGLILFGSVLFG